MKFYNNMKYNILSNRTLTLQNKAANICIFVYQ